MQRKKLEIECGTGYSTLYRDEYATPNIVGDGVYPYASRCKGGEKEVISKITVLTFYFLITFLKAFLKLFRTKWIPLTTHIVRSIAGCSTTLKIEEILQGCSFRISVLFLKYCKYYKDEKIKYKKNNMIVFNFIF